LTDSYSSENEPLMPTCGRCRPAWTFTDRDNVLQSN